MDKRAGRNDPAEERSIESPGMKNAADFPENHPLKQLFRSFTERGLAQASLHDSDLLLYLADLLVDFMFIENLHGIRDEKGNRPEYLIDMIRQAADSEMPQRKAYFKHLGDYSLFMLGMYPEYVVRPRRAFSPAWYEDTGRIGYKVAGELESHSERTMVYRKLSDKFDRCVVSLNWVREYTSDPFYQFMFRRFDAS
jgi:hypothetical protein